MVDYKETMKERLLIWLDVLLGRRDGNLHRAMACLSVCLTVYYDVGI